MDGFWKDKRVLVTGAGGFIGSHLVERLVAEGARVRAFVRYNSRGDSGLLSFLPEASFRQVEVMAGDLRDKAAVSKAVQECSHVFHLGALIAIPYSYVHPAEVVESNVIGTLNMLMAVREAGTERLVHTSTSEVYGTAQRVPIDEGHPLQGQSPYSASKIGADKLAESFYRSFDVPVVTLRPFNTYGPRQSARAVIPTIITQVLTRDEVHLGNLDALRDLTFVSDTVEGFLCAGRTSGVEGGTFNLGVGREVTVAALAAEIMSLAGRQLEIRVDSSRMRPQKSEVQRLLSDNSLAREKLGWTPTVDLRAGLTRTIEWVSANLALYRPSVYQI